MPRQAGTTCAPVQLCTVLASPQSHDKKPNSMRDMAPLRTYIVEDNPVILETLTETLEELAPVQVVGSASEERVAVNALRDNAAEIDLVIIDLFLAAGSGLSVLRSAWAMQLRAKRVVLTNYATPDIRLRCAALGADRVFDKSSEIESLIDYCGKLSEGATTVPGLLR